MELKRALATAAFLLGCATGAAAQALPAEGQPAGEAVGTAGTVDVSRLPISLDRIQREFRQTLIREERDGLNLRYFVEVFAQAPRLVLLTPQDNLMYGPVPYGAPTHREMLDMITPQEHRAPAADLGSLFRWLSGKKSD